MEIKFNSIGTIYTPLKTCEGNPIQPAAAKGIKGRIELEEEYVEGITDLDGFSHITLIFYFHKSKGYKLKVIPFLDNVLRGVFSTRAPKRPNQIGMSVVKLNSINGNILEIENVDIVDGTPLLDIKPYIPEFDNFEVTKTGWFDVNNNDPKNKKSDNRFSN